MRRFMLPIFAGLTLVAALTACDSEAPQDTAGPQPTATSTVTVSPTPKGDDKLACATAKSTRDAIINDLIMALMTVSDNESTGAELAEAAETMKTSYTKLGEGMNKAAEQAGSDKLKESLRTYAAGATTVLAKLQTAGADRSKLDAATELPEFDAAEKAAMAICA